MRVLFSEAWRSTTSRPLPASIGIVLSVLFIGAIAAIVARSDSEQRELREHLDAGISLVIEIQAGGRDPFLPEALVEMLPSVSGVDYAISASQARDVAITATKAGPIPMRVLYGTAPGLEVAPCHLSDHPRVSLSSATAEQFNLAVPIGAVETPDGSQFSIANFTSVPSELNVRLSGAMTRCADSYSTTSNDPVVSYVVVESIDLVSTITDVLEAIAAESIQDITVMSSTELAQYRSSIADEVSTQRTRGVWIATGSLTTLNLIIATATSILRRNEFGRRRVLGASRERLGAIVLCESLLVAGFALILGTIGIVVTQLISGPWLDLTWLPFLGVLVIASSIVGQFPVVTAAGLMDPVKILRVP